MGFKRKDKEKPPGKSEAGHASPETCGCLYHRSERLRRDSVPPTTAKKEKP